ncbi:MAG: DNA replication/repair protein RecF [Chloroflexota bacterium]
MYLRKLSLMNYRNYQRCLIDLDPGTTIFYGDNGQGKTNLLEAIYLLATTKSFRTTADRELMSWRAIKDRQLFARVEGWVNRDAGDLHMEMLLKGDTAAMSEAEESFSIAKSIKLNGLPARAAQIVGELNAVIFSPEDLELVHGAPAGRRRYLDITRSQTDRGYLRTLQRYQRVLTQRNHLLRQVRERRQDRASLSIWNDELINLGSLIVRHRLVLIDELNHAMADLYRRLTRTERLVALKYRATSQPDLGIVSAEEAHAAFRSRLDQLLPREVDQGVSLVGPHRDDFNFVVDGIDMGAFGSRGEQRIVAVALKLAEAAVIRSIVNDSPVLLLDDILSELDPARRQFVQEQIQGDFQTLITVADLSSCDDLLLAGAKRFRVERGTIVE